jgi:hypothetical protein
LNTIFERSKHHLVAFVAIAFISILAQRLKRIVAEDFSARHLQTDTHRNALMQHHLNAPQQ